MPVGRIVDWNWAGNLRVAVWLLGAIRTRFHVVAGHLMAVLLPK